MITVANAQDTDGDGILDDTEQELFGDLSRDGLQDLDGDGITDRDEIENGTDPIVAAAAPPVPPEILDPAQDTAVTTTEPWLVWDASFTRSENVRYIVDLAMDPIFNRVVESASLVSLNGQLRWQPTHPLDRFTHYHWRVRAIDRDSFSEWVYGRFYVNSSNVAPEGLVLDWPAPDAIIAKSRPVLAVRNPKDNNLQKVDTTFELYSDAAATHLVLRSAALPAGSSGFTHWRITGIDLTSGAQYFWRAIARDPEGLSVTTEMRAFTVDLGQTEPVAPALVLPEDAAAIDSRNVIFSATGSERILLTVDTSLSFNSPDLRSFTFPGSTAGETLRVTDLTPGKTYYWRAKAISGITESVYSAVRKFDLNDPTTTPPAPLIFNPGPRSTVQVLKPPLSIIRPSSHASLDEYEFEIFYDENLRNLAVRGTISGSSTWTPPTPLTDRRWYHWRARAVSRTGIPGSWSPKQEFLVFTHDLKADPRFTLLNPKRREQTATGQVPISWRDFDPDRAARIILRYKDVNDATGPGHLIADDLHEDADQEGDIFLWDTSGIPAGTYSVHGELVDDQRRVISLARGQIIVPRYHSFESYCREATSSPDAVAGTSYVKAVYGGKRAHALVVASSWNTLSLAVSPAVTTVPKGQSVAFAATALFDSDMTLDVTSDAFWSSQSPTIASISNGAGSHGEAATLSVGVATIMATLLGNDAHATLNVTPATMIDLELSPRSERIPVGAHAQFAVIGIFSDGTKADQTDSAYFSSSNSQVLTIGNSGVNKGRAEAIAVGNAIITVTVGTLRREAPVAVVEPSLVAIELSPKLPPLPTGVVQKLTAFGLYDDGRIIDLTTSVNWTSTEPQYAAIGNLGGEKGVLTTLSPGETKVSARLGDIEEYVSVSVTDLTLKAIEVAPPAISLAAGLTQKLRAYGLYSNGSRAEITDVALWTSSADAVATVSNRDTERGLATGLVAGRTEISVNWQDQRASAQITVTDAILTAIDVSPPTASLPLGGDQVFRAFGLYSDQSRREITSEVLWSAQDTDIATVRNDPTHAGTALAMALGGTTIIAKLHGTVGSAQLTVSAATLEAIEIAPATAQLPAGTSTAFTAIGRYSDQSTRLITSEVHWSTLAPEVATVSNAPPDPGTVSAVTLGTTILIATLGGVKCEASLVVIDPILVSVNLSLSRADLPLGTTAQARLLATYSDATTRDVTASGQFTSDSAEVATISNVPGTIGQIRSIGRGTTTIGGLYSDLTSHAILHVTDAELAALEVASTHTRVPLGLPLPMRVLGTFTDDSVIDVTNSCSFRSQHPEVATVSNAPESQGLLTPTGLGVTVVSAMMGGRTGQISITIVDTSLTSVKVTPDSSTVRFRDSTTFRADGTYSNGDVFDLTALATWTTDDQAIATISNAPDSRGRATGQGRGRTPVNATHDGVRGSTTLTVVADVTGINLAPAANRLAAGDTLQLTATAIYEDDSTSDATADAIWESSDSTLGAVFGGLVVAHAAGRITITARIGAVTASTELVVDPPRLVSMAAVPARLTLPKGLRGQVAIEGTYSDGTTSPVSTGVTFRSGDPSIAFADDDGTIHAVGTGSTTLTATFGDLSVEVPLIVGAPAIVGIAFNTNTASVPAGLSLVMEVNAHFSDGTQGPAVGVLLTSSNPAIAAVEGTGMRGLSAGQVTVTASLESYHTTTTLTVTEAELASIVVSPASLLLAVGTRARLEARGVYSDGSSRAVAGTLTWQSTNDAIVAVEPDGTVSARAAGDAEIKARVGNLYSLPVPAHVTAAELTSLTITDAPWTLAKGRRWPLIALATFSDQTIADVSPLALWSSDDSSVATVSAAGEVAAINMGHAVITANFLGRSAMAHLDILPPELDRIAISSPANTSLVRGERLQLNIVATYSDQSIADVTTVANYASSDESIATVDGGGQVLALDFGVADISARIGSITSSVTVTVGEGSTFALTCLDPSISIGSRKTVEAVLAVLGVADCAGTETFDTTLTVLDLTGRGLSDLSPLATLRALRWLYVDDNLIDDLSPLAGLTHLRGLYLDDNRIQNLASISDLTSLAHLSIDRNPVVSLSPLAELSSLVSLSINEIPDLDVSALSQLPSLVGLLADGANGAELLGAAPVAQLTALSLRHGGVKDIASLVDASSLVWLAFEENRIEDASPLADLEGVRTARLDANPIIADSEHCPLVAANQALTRFCVDYVDTI